MDITRRAAMIGTAASITIARLAHAVPSLTPSPFLRVYDDTADMVRVSAASMQLIPFDLARFYAGKLDVPPPRFPQFDTYTVTAADGIAVASMEEAEDRVIDLIPNPTMHARVPLEHRPFYCGDGMVSLPIVINRSSNLICARTRSKIADIALVSPDALKLISDNDYFGGGGTYYPVPERMVGRWTHVGRLHYCIDVFVGNHLPTNWVYIMRASEDNHAVLIRSDAGLHLVTDPAPITTQVAQAISWGQSRDFFNSVGFERV